MIQRPAARASASWSAEAGSASRTQLNPSSASIAKGSPIQSIDRGKKGSPSTSKTPRARPAGGSAAGAAAAAGCTSGSRITAISTSPLAARSSRAISCRPGPAAPSSTSHDRVDCCALRRYASATSDLSDEDHSSASAS